MFDDQNDDRSGDPGGASYIYGTVAELKSLLSGGWNELEERFSVEDIESHLARVRITHREDGSESFELELLGAHSVEDASHLDVEPSVAAFGEVALKTMKELPCFITNRSSSTVEIHKISKIGNDAVAFSTSGIGTPFKVLPGLKVQVNLHFVPRREGFYEAALNIETTAKDDPNLVIKLTGIGKKTSSVADDTDEDEPIISLHPNPVKVGDPIFYRYHGTEKLQCGIVVYDAVAHELYTRYRFDLLPGEHPIPVPLEFDGGKYFFRFLLPHTQRILSLEVVGKKKRPRGRPKKKRY